MSRPAFPGTLPRVFTTEEDSSDWTARLQIHGIDLRHTPSVEAFADHLCETLPRLDFILNNACQTVRRPPGFYGHLMADERKLMDALPDVARPLLESYEALRRKQDVPAADDRSLPAQVGSSLAGIQRAAELSQVPIALEDRNGGEELFPSGQLDGDLQQVDLRAINSWRLRLATLRRWSCSKFNSSMPSPRSF